LSGILSPDATDAVFASYLADFSDWIIPFLKSPDGQIPTSAESDGRPFDGGSLDWAIRHLKRYGDSNLFPRAFEFEVIAAAWDSIRKSLIAHRAWNAIPDRPMVVFVPKLAFGFRVATRLQPLDAVTFA